MTPLLSAAPIGLDDNIAEVRVFEGSNGLMCHARGFLEIARVALDASIKNQTAIDTITPSILYAIRHSVELFLKYAVVDVHEHPGPTASPPVVPVASHRLSNLWAKYGPEIREALALELHGPGFHANEWLKCFEHIIREFDQLDPTGQDLRYPTDTKGKANLGGRLQVSLRQVDAFAQSVDECFLAFIERSC